MGPPHKRPGAESVGCKCRDRNDSNSKNMEGIPTMSSYGHNVVVRSGRPGSFSKSQEYWTAETPELLLKYERKEASTVLLGRYGWFYARFVLRMPCCNE